MVDSANLLPFDFTQFVALRHELQPDAAGTLLEAWVSNYVPGPAAQAMVEEIAPHPR